jgi:hypothetical protein
MLISPIALDLAEVVMQDRLREAAHAALLAQVPSASRSSATARVAEAARVLLAKGLRNLAGRLDPTLGCEQCLAVPTSR